MVDTCNWTVEAMDNDTDTITATPAPQNGYDIPVYGLDNGSFYYIHVPAIVCIVTSFICVIIAITLSFKQRGCGTFFNWTKSERLVVYLAVCDGLYNVSHFTDHTHIIIVKDMVYPKELCEFYGFNLAVAITSQILMVNVVAINAFMLIYFDKNLTFGQRDWRLLIWTFGVPLLASLIAVSNGQMGPNGTFCFFDGVKGRLTNILFTTVPLVLVLSLNIVLYVLTWTRIHRQTSEIKKTLGTMSANMRASHRSARAMSMFVAAFFIQWWALPVYGIWGLVNEDIPQVIFHFVTIFSNIGGVLNLCVYLLIRRRKTNKKDRFSTMKRTFGSDLSRSSRIVTSSSQVTISEDLTVENEINSKTEANGNIENNGKVSNGTTGHI